MRRPAATCESCSGGLGQSSRYSRCLVRRRPPFERLLRRRHVCGPERMSRAELSKVMIRVQIGPPQPVGARHPAEERMPRTRNGRLSGRDDFKELLEAGDVRRESGRPRAVTLLIDLRAGRDARPPSKRKVQRHPLQDRWRKRAPGASNRRRAGRHSEAVAEMADHLVGRHPAPSTAALRSERPQPAPDVRLALIVRESLHACRPGERRRYAPMSCSPPASRKAACARRRPASASSTSARNAGSRRSASN